jgi:hypothetical protein
LQRQGELLTRQLQRKQDEYQEDVNAAQAEVVDRIGRKMIDVLDRYSRENGFVIVFDSSAQNSPVLYKSTQIDVTQDIVRLYDQAYPSQERLRRPAAKPAAEQAVDSASRQAQPLVLIAAWFAPRSIGYPTKNPRALCAGVFVFPLSRPALFSLHSGFAVRALRSLCNSLVEPCALRLLRWLRVRRRHVLRRTDGIRGIHRKQLEIRKRMTVVIALPMQLQVHIRVPRQP